MEGKKGYKVIKELFMTIMNTGNPVDQIINTCNKHLIATMLIPKNIIHEQWDQTG